MRYWWVNQKQTRRQEIGGGYLWSPKRNTNQAYNRFYENMKLVAPGDVVFSYWDTALRAHGVVRSFGYDAPKPEEFGAAGRSWSDIGYRADVDYVLLEHPVAPAREQRLWAQVQPLLPLKYSPLPRVTGNGLQLVYLAALPTDLGALLAGAIAARGNPLQVRDARMALLTSAEDRERDGWERHIISTLTTTVANSTEREAIVRARRGQGVFRRNVAQVEMEWRVTRVSNPAYLIASHIKPWRHASNDERLSGDNGFMLAPHADFLFDRGFISFAEGRLLVSPVADERSLVKLGVDPERPPEIGTFSKKQEEFLEFHRRDIFRSAG